MAVVGELNRVANKIEQHLAQPRRINQPMTAQQVVVAGFQFKTLVARLRLQGFPWTQYGSIAATVESVGSEVRDGRVRVELAIDPHNHTTIPIQHGLPGSVEVQVEQVSPATLALRAAGRLVTSPKTLAVSEARQTAQ